MRSRGLPHAWVSSTLPPRHEAHRRARLMGGGVGSQTGRSQPIPALLSEKQQQQKAIEIIRALLLLLEPEVEKNP